MKLSQFKNPIVAEKGNIFSLEDWAGGLLWVVFIGAVFTLGGKIAGKIDDAVTPGSDLFTPKAYRTATMQQKPADTVKIY